MSRIDKKLYIKIIFKVFYLFNKLYYEKKSN